MAFLRRFQRGYARLRGRVSQVPSSLENITGAVVAWLMDELSGNIVDAVAGVTVPADGSLTYNVSGTTYGTGITFDGSSGFHTTSHKTEMDLGTTTDCNILIVFKASSPGTSAVFIETTNIGTGNPGYEVRMSGSSLAVMLCATDGTSTSVNWSRSENAALDAAFDGQQHTIEMRINRTAHTVNCYVDGTQLTVSADLDISAVGGKNITGAGVGIGCDYRGTFGGLFTGTIYFIRQKASLT